MLPRIEVKTLDNEGLRQAAISMNNMIFKDFVPDIIVGIRSGGYVMAEIMAKEASHQPILLAISRRRKSTETKSKIKGLKNLLGFLPYFVTDHLRIWEHKRLNGKPVESPKPFVPDADELAKLKTILQPKQGHKILIVDDAVDSGATMKAVLDMVRSEAGSSSIVKTAALTLTTEHSLVNPDYVIYKNVLVRFPWSFDFKI